MVGYFCATPFHITAAITLQSGQFKGKKSKLIILNHFNVDEQLVNRIRETEVFDEVILYDNKYRTLFDNFKRFVNNFVPVKLMRSLANETEFTHFVCFALDFIDLTYIMKRYKKRKIDCEFSFGDDGIGTYIREGIYYPKKVSEILLKLNGRLKYVSKIKKAYTYKPEYMVANKGFDLTPILQDKEACEKRRKAVSHIWPLNEDVNIDGGILYFEQPNESDKNSQDQKIELQSIDAAIEILNTHSAIKMHPRSPAVKAWEKYGIIKTRMPYEVMLLQKQCAPALMMTVGSTALFSTYLFDDLGASDCPSVLLYKLMIHQNEALTEAMNKLCSGINRGDGQDKIYCPDSVEELKEFLKSVAQNRENK